jgi:predicted RNA binding protein YcfA (HicA-like mRNA interferase family)
VTTWPSTKARRVLAALIRIGWQVKRQTGSHRTLTRPDWPDYVFAFHDNDEIGRACSPALQSIRVEAHRSVRQMAAAAQILTPPPP